MGLAHSLARHYRQHRFTALFGVLLLTIAGHGFVERAFPVADPLVLLLGFSLVAVVFSARKGPLRWVLGGLVAIAVAARLTQGLVDHPAPLLLAQAMVALACVLAAGVAMHRALVAGPVNVEHICAALDAYLLAGIAFGAVYWLIATVVPGSFSTPSAEGLTPPRAIYFSFVTQATLGYGDIVPLDDRAQGLVIAQGVGGQMYLAVLVARLVSLYSAQEKR